MAVGVDDVNPVIDVAREKTKKEADIIEVNGIRFSIVPVSAALIEEVTRRVKDPPIPVVFNVEMNRSVENPGDPNYLLELSETTSKRNRAAIDAFALFGIELKDGLPSDDSWLNKLKYLSKLGHISLDGFDLNDDLDKEFLLKRYVLVSGDVLERVSRASGVNPADIEAAEKSFRSPASGNTD